MAFSKTTFLPFYIGCCYMSQTKKYATRQDIVQNMVKSTANIYGWTLKVPEACPVGKVSGTFSLGFEEGADKLMTVTMTRIVVNVNGQDADYFVPEYEKYPLPQLQRLHSGIPTRKSLFRLRPGGSV